MLKDVFNCEGDSRSIYSVDLLPSDKFLMSIQTNVHPSEAYHNLLTTGCICSFVCHYGIERATVERSSDISGWEILVPLLSTSRFASARRCTRWVS